MLDKQRAEKPVVLSFQQQQRTQKAKELRAPAATHAHSGVHQS
jgi:hypothetical protein